jgi:hypothetical protein
VLALQVDGMVSQGPRQEHGYRITGRLDKLEGAEERLSSPAQDAVLAAEAQRNPFAIARELKAAANFPGQKSTVISRLK